MASNQTLFTISLSLSPTKSHSYRITPVFNTPISSQWTGLRQMGISIKPRNVKFERKVKCNSGGGGRSGVVFASLFGVGAPEALVIGVVALLVFGPKGLAEVARNLGKTLRAFQPTIRELQDVSREFKSTLEREIGLDEIPPSMQSTYKPPTADTSTVIPTPARTNGTSPIPDVENVNSQAVIDQNGTQPMKEPYTSEEYLKITEEQLKANPMQQQTLYQENQSELQPKPQDAEVPPEKPFNAGEFLMQAQMMSNASEQQGQSSVEKDESEPQSQPQGTILESKKPKNEV